MSPSPAPASHFTSHHPKLMDSFRCHENESGEKQKVSAREVLECGGLGTYLLSQSHPLIYTSDVRVGRRIRNGLMAPDDHLLELCPGLQRAQRHVLILRIDVDDLGPTSSPACRLGRILLLDNHTAVALGDFDHLAVELSSSEVGNLLGVCRNCEERCFSTFRDVNCSSPESAVEGIQYESAGPTVPSWWIRHGRRFGMALAVEPFLWSIDSIVCSISPVVGLLQEPV